MAETDESVKSALRELLHTPLYEDDKRILIEFDYKGQHYETKFLLSKTVEAGKKLKEKPASGNYKEQIYLRNDCISIAFTSKKTEKPDRNDDFFTELEKNDKEEACFKPRLETLGPIKTIDVLQVLKTKLETLFPTTIPLELADAMAVDGIEMSPNRIMRGGDAYYEKYGYGSELLEPVKKWIRSLEWGDVSAEIKDLIHPHLPSADIDPSTKFITIMEGIPLAIFNTWTSKGYTNLFEKVHDLFLSANGLPNDTYRHKFIFTLDVTSPKWIEWEKTLVFTDVKVLASAAGGARGTRGTRCKRRTSRTKKRSRRSRKQR